MTHANVENLPIHTHQAMALPIYTYPDPNAFIWICLLPKSYQLESVRHKNDETNKNTPQLLQIIKLYAVAPIDFHTGRPM